MTTLTDFLFARIAEDEAVARGVADSWDSRFSARFDSWESDHSAGDSAFVDRFNPARVLAECEAKRRIVERCSAVDYAMPFRTRPALCRPPRLLRGVARVTDPVAAIFERELRQAKLDGETSAHIAWLERLRDEILAECVPSRTLPT